MPGSCLNFVHNIHRGAFNLTGRILARHIAEGGAGFRINLNGARHVIGRIMDMYSLMIAMER
jgi:flagellar biosynthesis protein FliR